MIVGFPFNGDQIGGSAISSIALLRGLRSLGVDTRIILHGDGAMADEVARHADSIAGQVIRLRKVGAHAMNSRPHRFQVASYLAGGECYRAIKRHNIDIIHLNDLAMLRTWCLPSRIAGARSVVHWRSNYKKSWSVDLGLRTADRIVAIAHYNKNQLPAFAAARAIVEYNPCGPILDDAARLEARARIRRQLHLPPNARVVGIFGMHIVRKRTHLLADILNAVPETSAGAPVFGLACGEKAEPYDHEIDAKVERFGLQQRLLRPGFVRPAEDWMAACDVLVAPAIREPFGRAALEAAQVGVPLIMSSDSGASEVIVDRKTGLVLDPEDVPAWIAATRELLEDTSFATQLATNAKENLKDFMPERHAARIFEIYSGLLGAAGAKAA